LTGEKMTHNEALRLLRDGYQLHGSPNHEAPFSFYHPRRGGWAKTLDAAIARELLDQKKVSEQAPGIYVLSKPSN
jgi:hypothetical protein